METLDDFQTDVWMPDVPPSLASEDEDLMPGFDLEILEGMLKEHFDFSSLDLENIMENGDAPQTPYPKNSDLETLLDNVECYGETDLPAAMAIPDQQTKILKHLRDLDFLEKVCNPVDFNSETDSPAAMAIPDQQTKIPKHLRGEATMWSTLVQPDGQKKNCKRRREITTDCFSQRKRGKKKEKILKTPDNGSAGFATLQASMVTTPPPSGLVQITPSLQTSVTPSLHPLIPLHITPLGPTFCFSPTLFRSSGQHTFLLVSSPSRVPENPSILPLCPVDSAVAPDSMCSSPPGSQSDCASKAMSPPSASPVSPRIETDKGSPDIISNCVADYIHQTKANIKTLYQELEAGRSLETHYIDVKLVQRQILIGSGKNASKCLEKELVVLGDTERRCSLLSRSQMFQSSTGAKPKNSVVLLGNAGMGKTTLIKKLCLDWSDGLLPQFDFVFLLDGKALTLPQGRTYSLQSLLLRLSSSAPASPCARPHAVFNRVLSTPGRVLMIFDGFEAVRDLEGLTQCPAVESRGQNYSVRQLFSGLLQRRLLPGCSLLLSARLQGTVSGLLRRADCLLELPGFSPHDVERYFQRYFSGQSLPTPVPTSNSTLATVPALNPVLATVPALNPVLATVPALNPVLATVPALNPVLATVPALNPVLATVPALNPVLDTVPALDTVLDTVPALNPVLDTVPAQNPVLDTVSAQNPVLDTVPALNPVLDTVPALNPVLDTVSAQNPVLDTVSAQNPVLAKVLEGLHNHSYLMSLCWNPELCHKVCLLLEHWDGSKPLPSTLTGLVHTVMGLIITHSRKNSCARTRTRTHTHTQKTTHSPEHTDTQMYGHSPEHTDTQMYGHSPEHTLSQSETQTHTRTDPQTHANTTEAGQKGKRKQTKPTTVTHMLTRSQTQTQTTPAEENIDEEEVRDRHVLSELNEVAWDGVKGHSSLLTLTQDNPMYIQLLEFGLKTGLIHSYWLRGWQGGDCGPDDSSCDNILSWGSPFLQSFLGGAHLSISKCVSDRALISQILPQPRGRRRPLGECLDLAQRLAVGLVFRKEEELPDPAVLDSISTDARVAKQAAVLSHLENLPYGNLSPARLLGACHCVYETGNATLARQLVRKLPATLSFRGVPLCPPDAVVVWTLLDQCRTPRRQFHLDLEDTGLGVSGLRLLTSLNNVHAYRASIADTITMWEELETSGEAELLNGAVSKMTINPFRATQVSHVQHLAKLVNIHRKGRLLDSQLGGVLEGGIPAVKDLHKLEFELGPVNGPLALPKLLELLPALHSLQHLDLENSKLGDSGSEGLAETMGSLSSLGILNLSQNHIGDQGIGRLAPALCRVTSLTCLSLYSNVISDGGAESLAAVLPQMTSLNDLDVKYNKFTAVGAQSLGSSLRNCPWVKSLGLWNQCIPYGVLERLQEQDPRIQLL